MLVTRLKRITRIEPQIIPRIAAVAIVLSALLVSCKREGQPLASYQDEGNTRNITRGEVKKFVIASAGSLDPKMLTVAFQDEILQNIALVQVAALAGRKEKLDATDEFKRNAVMLDRRAMIFAYDLYLKLHADDHIYRMFEGQLLYLRRDPSHDRRPEAEDLLKKLNDSDEGAVEKIMFASNENNRYKMQGGHLDPYCISCAPNPLSFLTDPVKDKSDRKFVLVDNEQGYFLIRNLHVREVKGKDLAKVFLDGSRRAQLALKKFYAQSGTPAQKDEKKPGMMTDEEMKKAATEQAEAQVRRETRSLLGGVMEAVKAKYPVTLPEMKNPPEPWKVAPPAGTLLFKIGDKEYHYEDLKKELSESYSGPALSPMEEYMLAMQVLLNSELLMRSEGYEAVKKSGEVEYVKQHVTDQLVANLYVSQAAKDLKVSDADIQQYFELRRFNEFKGKTLAQVKEQISGQMLQEKRQATIQDLKKKLFDTYKVKIEREKLKEGEL